MISIISAVAVAVAVAVAKVEVEVDTVVDTVIVTSMGPVKGGSFDIIGRISSVDGIDSMSTFGIWAYELP